MVVKSSAKPGPPETESPGADLLRAQDNGSNGPTRSDRRTQVHAGVSNLPLPPARVPEAPALGSSILGAVGAGLHGILSAARHMVHFESQTEPDPDMPEVSYHEASQKGEHPPAHG